MAARPSQRDTGALGAPEGSERGRAGGWRRLRSSLALVLVLAVTGTVVAAGVATVLFLLNLALRHTVGDVSNGP